VTAVLLLVTLAFVAVAGFVAVFTMEPRRQAITLSLFGLCLALLFVVLQAPDVALSELAVGSAVLPLLILLTLRKVGGR
jgi:energy-converting hydrogenase B subunit D